MIIGLGTDIVRMSRIKSLSEKYGPKFLARILTKDEQNKYNSIEDNGQREAYLTKRFAAKEAFVKALGTGFDSNISFQDISVLNDKNGKPYYNVNDKLDKYVKKLFNLKKYLTHISISDDIEYASAVAIIEKVE